MGIEEVLGQFEAEYNEGEPLFFWRARDVARLLGVTQPTARRRLQDVDDLGRYAYLDAPRGEVLIERDGLVKGLKERLIPIRSRNRGSIVIERILRQAS